MFLLYSFPFPALLRHSPPLYLPNFMFSFLKEKSQTKLLKTKPHHGLQFVLETTPEHGACLGVWLICPM